MTVEESQPRPHRLPSVIAELIAAVSSVVPSPGEPRLVLSPVIHEAQLTFGTIVLDIAIDLESRIAEGNSSLTLDVRYPIA